MQKVKRKAQQSVIALTTIDSFPKFDSRFC